MRKILAIVLAAVMLLGVCSLGGCSAERPSPDEDGVLRIVCTVFPAYDFCRELTRGLPDGSVELILLGRNGKDMHSYEPSAADIVELARADLLVCVGGGTEAWVDATLEAADNPALRVFYMMEACETSTELHDGEVCEDHDHDHDHAEGAADEHVWVSLRRSEQIVAALCEEIAALTSGDEQAAVCRENAEAYRASLLELDAQYEETVRGAPRSTVLIADRYPFAYLMDDYHIDCVAAFPGCSTETSASFATQTMLVETVETQGLPYIFVIDGTDSVVATMICERTGAEILRLSSGQVVTDTQLRDGVTYLSMAEQNLENLKKALYES